MCSGRQRAESDANYLTAVVNAAVERRELGDRHDATLGGSSTSCGGCLARDTVIALHKRRPHGE